MESIVEKETARLESKAENMADKYLKKYRPFIESLESSSVISKVRSVTPYDIYAVGSMLEAWEDYYSMCEEDGNLNTLGKLPNVALDVITASYGTSPISVISSVQPLDEEQGIVYYKEVIAKTTRGNLTEGDTISEVTKTADQTAPQGYSSDKVTGEDTGQATDGVAASFSFTTQDGPVRTESVVVTVDGTALSASDDGQGNLIGNGIWGTVNYLTGSITIEGVVALLGTGNGILVTYQVNWETSADLPQIQMRMATKGVKANVYALKDTIGLGNVQVH